MTNESTKTGRAIALYGRVSTARQEDEQTIKTQLVAAREFAQKNGYTIVEEYLDEGWSGTILARPGLDRLRSDARKKLWDAVLIYDPDRLARVYFYQELVMDELREIGVETLFVTVPPSKNHEDQLMNGVRGVFAQYERMKITERFRLGKVRKAKEGHIVSSDAPYGYALVTKKGKVGDADFIQTHYEINETEARVVRLIFGWLANDRLTIRKVVKRLQELGVLPRKSRRGVWNTSTLTTMLRNKTYIGEGRYGSSYAVVPVRPLKNGVYKKNLKTSRKMRPEEEWVKVPTPVIIGQDTFIQAQRQIRINFEMSSRNKKNNYLLGGKIRCVCGCTRTGEGPQHGKHLYYRCANRVKSYPLPPTCQEKGINARIADGLVWSKVSQLMSSPGLLQKNVERWLNDRGTKTQDVLVDVQALEKEVAKLEKQESRYLEAYSEGVFSVEKLRELATPLKERINSVKTQIVHAQSKSAQTQQAAVPTLADIKAFAKKATAQLQDLNFEAKRAIVMNIVDRVIGTQKEMQVYGYIPVTNHVEYKTIDRNCRAAECRQVHPF